MNNNEMNYNGHREIYSFPKLYDIAFDFKDLQADCDFFDKILIDHGPIENSKSYIEFAAGPALHCLEMAKRGYRSTAVDISAEMKTYALDKARKKKLDITYVNADMTSFRSNDKFDIAAMLMDSVSYLLTNEDVINHLKCAASSLNSGGIYIIEMAHPKNVFNIEKTTANEWEAERDGCKVKFKWGSDDDVFDHITQITNVSCTIHFTDNGKEEVISDKSPLRSFTATEFAALVSASGVFDMIKVYGDLKTSVGFSNKKESWRMVPVLKKK